MISKMIGGYITIVEMPKGKSTIIRKQEAKRPQQTYEEYARERRRVERLMKR